MTFKETIVAGLIVAALVGVGKHFFNMFSRRGKKPELHYSVTKFCFIELAVSSKQVKDEIYQFTLEFVNAGKTPLCNVQFIYPGLQAQIFVSSSLYIRKVDADRISVATLAPNETTRIVFFTNNEGAEKDFSLRCDDCVAKRVDTIHSLHKQHSEKLLLIMVTILAVAINFGILFNEYSHFGGEPVYYRIKVPSEGNILHFTSDDRYLRRESLSQDSVISRSEDCPSTRPMPVSDSLKQSINGMEELLNNQN